MANDAQEVLAKLSLDTTDWKAKIKEAKDVLSDAFADQKSQAADAQAENDKANQALKDQLSAYKQNLQEVTKVIGQQQKSSAELEKQIAQLKAQAVQTSVVAAANAAATAQAAKASAMQEAASKKIQESWQKELVAQDRRIQKEQEAAHAQELAAIKAQALEKSRNETIQKRLELLAKEREESKLIQEQNEKRQVTQKLISTVGGAVIGSRGGVANQALGLVTAGMFGGPEAAIGVAAVEATGEAIAGLVEKFKELVKASGQLTQLQDTFEKLAQSKGISDTAAFLDKLRKATRNLAPDIDILRTANTFLQSPVKMSEEEMTGLTADVTNLSRARGLSPTSALSALQQFFLTGRSWSLARQVGIPRQELQARGYGPMMSEQDKMQAQANQTQQVIHQQAQKIGTVPTTFPEALQSLSTVQGRLEESFGQGLTKAGGFGQFTEWLAGTATKLGTTQDAFEEFGRNVGQVLGTVAEVARGLTTTVGLLLSSFTELAKPIDMSSSIKKTEEDLTGFQTFLLQFMHMLNLLAGGVKELANTISLVGNVAGAINGNGAQEAQASAYAHDHPGQPNPYVSTDQRSTSQKIQDAWKSYQTTNQDTGESIDTASQNMYHSMLQGNQTNQMQQELKTNPDIKKLVQDVQEKYNKTGKGVIPDDVRTNLVTQIGAILTKTQKQQNPNDNIESALVTQVAGGYVSNIGKPTDQRMPDPGLARKVQEKAIQEQQQLSDAQAAQAFQKAKDRIQDEADLNEKMYKQGTEEAKAYYNTKIDLADKTYQATKAQAEQELAAKTKQIQGQVGLQGLTQGEADTQIQIQRIETQNKITAALREANQQKSQAGEGITSSDQQQQIAHINQVLEATKSAIQLETAEVENGFKEQTVSAKDYLEQRIDLINQEVEATRQAQLQKLALKPLDQQTQEASLQAMQQAVDQAKSQLQQLKDSYTQSVFQSTQQHASTVGDTLQSRLSIAGQGYSGQTDVGTPASVTQQQITNNKALITSLEEQLENSKQIDATWFSIYSSLLKAVAAQQQLNTQLQDSLSLLTPIGQVFDTIGSNLQGIFGSHFAKGVESSLTSVGKQFENKDKYTSLMSGGGTTTTEDPRLAAIVASADQASKGLITSTQQSETGLQKLANAFIAATNVVDNFSSALSKKSGSVSSDQGSGGGGLDTQSTDTAAGSIPLQPTQNMNNLPTQSTGQTSILGDLVTKLPVLTKQLTGFVESFGSAVQGILGSGSATAGAFAGFGGGASAGGAAGSALASSSLVQNSSMSSGMTSMLGPMGAAAGAIGGMLIGMISGQKQEQIQDLINQMNVDFKQMMDAYSSNNANLSQTIQAIQGLINEAQAEEANSKKDSGQFAQLIIQYNEQITQLQNQAEATMTSLQEQLVSLAAPTAYQSILQQVASVVQQYEQFASAATSTQQLAQANQFLASSLEQMATTDANTLIQDQESAVNSALQLNQLLLQRNDLQYQYLQQTESIMGQGTITRQQTSAQSKYAQMYMASYQYSVQLDQINQQIALTQYQVQAAQQVFNLATTKAGLEAQSLQLQEIGINQDMARIAAMQQLLSTLNGSGYSILGGTSNSDPNSQAISVLLALLSAMGLGGVANGVSGGTDAGTSSALAALYAQLTALGGGGTTSTGQGNGI